MIRLSIFIVITLLFYNSALANEYCIYDVKMPEETKETLFGIDSEFNFPDNEVIYPQTMVYIENSPYPYIYSAIRTPVNDKGYKSVGNLIWGINDKDLSLTKPHIFKWWISGGIVYIKQNNYMVLIAQRESTNGTGTHVYGSNKTKTYQSKIFTYDFKSSPKPLDSILEQELEWPRAIVGSEILGGYIISSAEEKEPASMVYRTYLLKNSKLQKLPIKGVWFIKDLTELNLVVALGSDDIYILNSEGKIVDTRRINSGDDYGGFSNVHLLNDNWLYIAGAQYDHVAKLDPHTGFISKIYRIREASDSDNFFVSLLMNTFDLIFELRDEDKEKWGLTQIYRAKKNRVYSSASKTLFFCEDKAIWEDGHLKDINEDVSLELFVGNIDSIGVSLFWGDNKLFSYDGNQWTIVSENIERGILEKPEFINRYFYKTQKDKSYELIANEFGISVVLLNIQNTHMFTRFMSLPNSEKIFVLADKEILTLDKGKISSLAKFNKRINLGGFMPIKYVPSMRGILFSTTVLNTKQNHLKLLKECE